MGVLKNILARPFFISSFLSFSHGYFLSLHIYNQYCSDGNGHVGHLLLFRECLRNNIMPFVIDNEHKLYYYRGLSEFQQTSGFLVGAMRQHKTCQ